jgi:aspartyl-tRNA(Asn)/glutamyl-tRNA(Gln) amidotransferase subunit A
MTEDLAYLTIAEAGARFRQRTLSPVELTRAVLDRIDATEDRVHSYVTVLAESALAEAETTERELFSGNDRGPLHGIPLALKDLYATAGIPTTAASRLLKDSVPVEDATAVAFLRRAGMVHLGKLVMHEFDIGGLGSSGTQSVESGAHAWRIEQRVRFSGCSRPVPWRAGK